MRAAATTATARAAAARSRNLCSMICAGGPPAGPHLHLALALRLQRVLALRLHLVLARQLHLVLVLRLQLVLARRQPRPPLRDRAHESTRGLSRDRAETTETS